MTSASSDFLVAAPCDCQQIICTCRAAPNAYFRWKGALDRIIALVLLVFAAPLIGLLVICIRLSSRGPGIYSQARVGRNGRIFTMFKLRSMRIDAEAATGPVWASVSDDPRVTRLGYWLRRLHLDELPQFFNVLRGDMSLVGPRPERPEFVRVLGEQVPGYLDRLQVAPGITGLAQVNLPPDTDLESVRRKIQLDRAYLKEATFSLDTRLILCTALRIFGFSDKGAASVLGLVRHVDRGVTHSSFMVNEPATPDAIESKVAKTVKPSHGRDPGRSGLSRARSTVGS
jgi:lipopolysaccharide/colanic/teichoic acid biosynthesis glycosyltransferase